MQMKKNFDFICSLLELMERSKFYMFPGRCLAGDETGLAAGDTYAKMLEDSGTGEKSGWL
jgi:hypothetical protein